MCMVADRIGLAVDFKRGRNIERIGVFEYFGFGLALLPLHLFFEAQPRVLIRRALREGRGRKGHGASAQHHAPEAKQGNGLGGASRSEEHTSELQSLMRTSYAVSCLKQKTNERLPRSPSKGHIHITTQPKNNTTTLQHPTL